VGQTFCRGVQMTDSTGLTRFTRAVYSSSLYAARGQNTSVSSFSADNVFSDGEQYQLCTMSANAATGGYDAALTVGIAL